MLSADAILTLRFQSLRSVCCKSWSVSVSISLLCSIELEFSLGVSFTSPHRHGIDWQHSWAHVTSATMRTRVATSIPQQEPIIAAPVLHRSLHHNMIHCHYLYSIVLHHRCTPLHPRSLAGLIPPPYLLSPSWLAIYSSRFGIQCSFGGFLGRQIDWWCFWTYLMLPKARIRVAITIPHQNPTLQP